MTYYFLDTSAFVKRYVPELGTAWMRSLTAVSAGHTFLVAYITSVEFVSGVSRSKRQGLISVRTASAVRLLANRYIERECVVIDLNKTVLQRAQDLLERHPLRSFDAVQLASALEAQASLLKVTPESFVFLSADTRLLFAAVAEGLTTDDPNSHP